MSYNPEAVKIETPVPNSELDDATKNMFHDLVEATYNIPWRHGTEQQVKGACENLDQQIRQAVSDHPILVKVIDKVLLDWSLLFVACEKLHSEWCFPIIQFLIEKNPSALLWKRRDMDFGGASAIHAIASHRVNCRLMPWIAENYAWVLDHKICKRDKPVFPFLRCYVNQDCPASDVRRFFQAYPKALSQKDMMGDIPLGAILGGYQECDASLFKFMAEQHPKAMKHRGRVGISILEHVIFGLSEFPHYSNESLEIIKFLIKECPKLVRIKDGRKAVPIHFLVDKCNRGIVQDAVILLLKAYPESYDLHAKFHKAPSKFPFVQRIKPILDREAALREAASTFTNVSTDLPKATKNSSDSLLQGVSNVVESWSKGRLQTIQVELQGIPAQIEAIKNEFEGPDVEPDDEEDFDSDDDGQNPEWNDDGEENEEVFSDDSDEMEEDSDGDY